MSIEVVKQAMGGLFNQDGVFTKVGNLLADVMILSLIWLVFSLPVLTAGAATTAVYYISTRRVSNREGYLFRDFWKSFRMNFVQSTLVWVAALFCATLFYMNIRIISGYNLLPVVLIPVQLFLALELLFMLIYIFPIIARFDMKTQDAVKSAFAMANRHIPTTLFCVFFMILLAIATLFFQFLILFDIVIYAFAVSGLLMRVFKKYRPDMDSDDSNLV